ncbi:MAG: hypothetical protein KF754_13485 [Planctomycetes bacterium]|nr:hypothetical protein [Planctomycetota bacterium]
MRKLIAPAAVLLAGFMIFTGPAPQAQQGPRDPAQAGGEEIERKGKTVLAAFQSMSPESVFGTLAPWRRNEFDLHRARLRRDVDRKTIEWDTVDKLLHDKRRGLDPARKLAVSDLAGFSNLTSAQFFGLFFGMYRLATDSEFSTQLASEWFTTRRAVGEGGFDDWQRIRMGLYISELGGYVRFENLDGFELVVCCVADGGTWHVQEIFFTAKSERPTTMDAAIEAMDKASIGLDQRLLQAKMAEGEQMLGSMRGQVRVAYAKAGAAPKKLTGATGDTDFGAGVSKEELDGKYFKIRDTVRGSKGWGALIADPKEEGLQWVLVLFKYAGGGGEFRQYDSETELLAELQELETTGWGESD